MKTLEQVERMKEKAARFVSNVLGDDDRAAEIDDESPEDYADRKRIQISANPQKRSPHHMATTTKADLEARIEELETENEELKDKLDAIGEVLDDDDSTEDDSPDDDSPDDDSQYEE
ncbi:MAG TPA: hypothetical protein VGK29_06310 [Paludibaculum sp.]